WYSRADDPDRVYLYRDGVQIGGWCYRAMHYRPFDGRTWGAPSQVAPVQPPQRVSYAASSTWQSSPRRRGLRGRIYAGMDQAIRNYITSPGFLSGLKLDLKLDGLFDSLRNDSYLADVFISAKLFAHIEMGGKLSDKDEFAGQYYMTRGSAHLFLSQRAGF